MVSFSFESDETRYAYKLTNAAKYNADFDQLIEDFFPAE